mmetsp:Transcript_12096/g.28580  ORF Transcript_12096/g.28580 Transcript_12096/m.28580 type:complete len:331 (-) Transcript_12096:14-1006(-)
MRGRKLGSGEEWRHFVSCKAAALELGPGFYQSTIWKVANGMSSHARGWVFRYTRQYEAFEGETWRPVVLGGEESGARVSDRSRFRDTRGIVKSAPVGAAPEAWQVFVNGMPYLFDHLVCTAWHGPPPTPGHTHVKHLDVDPSNNTPTNLEWATPGENIPRSRETNPNRKSSAGSRWKSVQGRKQGTADEWTRFESCAAAVRKLGSGFHAANIMQVAKGSRPHVGGWTFEFTKQREELAGEVWKDVVLSENPRQYIRHRYHTLAWPTGWISEPDQTRIPWPPGWVSEPDITWPPGWIPLMDDPAPEDAAAAPEQEWMDDTVAEQWVGEFVL